MNNILTTGIECAMTFHMTVQHTPAIFSRDADLTETLCIFQWILERHFMYFAGKLVYPIVLASVQFAISFILCIVGMFSEWDSFILLVWSWIRGLSLWIKKMQLRELCFILYMINDFYLIKLFDMLFF